MPNRQPLDHPDQFPGFMYHPEKGARLFNTAEEFKSAGDGWYDTEANFPKQKGTKHDAPTTAPEVKSAPPEKKDSTAASINSPEEMDILREAAKKAGIKGYQFMKRETLIKRLKQ